MAKQVLIVGGGVIAITAAYFKAKQGCKVTIVEASDELGGLLKSSSSKFGSFDYGTHIASLTGVKKLDDFLFTSLDAQLHKFDTQESGSFFNNELTSCSPFLNLNSLNKEHIKNAEYELLQAPSDGIYENLEVTIKSLYGPTAYQQAFYPYIKQTFGEDPSNLPSNYIKFFDMYRVLAFDKKTTSQLKKVDYLNDKLGFHNPTVGAVKFYPKNGGIGAWSKSLVKKITDMGVRISLDTTVSTIDYQKSYINIQYGESKQKVDELIWTISSAHLIKLLPLQSTLKPVRFRKTALVDFVYEKPLTTQCKYINNFSSTHLATRLTCYQNLVPDSKFYAVTVEVLLDNIQSEESLVNKISLELIEMGLVDLDNNCLHSQYRNLNEGFPVISIENDLLLQKLNSEILNSYPKIELLGRSSSKGFFMPELLKNAYQCGQKQDI